MLATLNRVLPQEIIRDPRLHRTSKFLYLGMRSLPKTTIAGYATALGMAYPTVHRFMKELERHEWVYIFRRVGEKAPIYVPWMPMAVERKLATYTERLAGMAANRGEQLMKFMLDIIVDDDNFVDNSATAVDCIGARRSKRGVRPLLPRAPRGHRIPRASAL